MTLESLAARIARDIFAYGDTPGSKCQRLEFKGGEYPHRECAQGGLNESALARTILESLNKRAEVNLK